MVNTPSLRAQIKPGMVLLKAGLREIDVIKRLNTYTQWLKTHNGITTPGWVYGPTFNANAILERAIEWVIKQTEEVRDARDHGDVAKATEIARTALPQFKKIKEVFTTLAAINEYSDNEK